jgi:hypothetical protein
MRSQEIEKKSKIKFCHIRNFFESQKYLSTLNILAALLILPFFTTTFSDIKHNIANYIPSWDEYYYQSIFNKNKNFSNIGTSYVQLLSEEPKKLSLTFLGETIENIFYKISGGNIAFTYYFFSYIFLILWIYLIKNLIENKNNIHKYKSLMITIVLLFVFYSNYRLIEDLNYPFARIMHPQASVAIWLLGILLIAKIIETESTKQIIAFSSLLFISSFSYFYVFLALLSSNLILIIYLFKKGLRKKILISLIFGSIATIPFLILNLKKTLDIGDYEALERMGLISYRYPGSLTNLIVCGLIILAISLKCMYFGQKKSISSKELTLVITCVGLIIASQSNTITNREIQFYHFTFLASVNLMIFLGVIIYGLNFKSLKKKSVMMRHKLPRDYFILPVLTISLIYSTNSIWKPVFTEWRAGIPVLTDINKIIKNKNVIVDNLNVQNSLSIYESTNILYNRVIAANGYTNKEVFERAYVSSGCPNEVTKLFISNIFVYRVSGLEQKARSLKRMAEYLNLESQFAFIYEPVIIKSKLQNAKVLKEISEYKKQIDRYDCLTAAKNLKINTIIFDELSYWNKIGKNSNLRKEKIRFGDIVLYYYKI